MAVVRFFSDLFPLSTGYTYRRATYEANDAFVTDAPTCLGIGIGKGSPSKGGKGTKSPSSKGGKGGTKGKNTKSPSSKGGKGKITRGPTGVAVTSQPTTGIPQPTTGIPQPTFSPSDVDGFTTISKTIDDGVSSDSEAKVFVVTFAAFTVAALLLA